MTPLRDFFVATIERATKSFGQAGVLAIGADQLNVLDADWRTVLGFAAGGFVLSVLTSFASIPVGGTGPSLTSVETVDPELPAVDVEVNDPDDEEEPHEASADAEQEADAGD